MDRAYIVTKLKALRAEQVGTLDKVEYFFSNLPNGDNIFIFLAEELAEYGSLRGFLEHKVGLHGSNLEGLFEAEVSSTDFYGALPRLFWSNGEFDIQGYKEALEEIEKLPYGNDNVDVFIAADRCGINYEDIEECYGGAHLDDADYMKNHVFADDVRNLPQVLRDSIDWEHVAAMCQQSFVEDDCHYFKRI